jgi:hypothetical protein
VNLRLTTARSVARAVFVLTLVASAGAARADGRDPVAAEALFEAGRQAMQRADYAAACPRFAESQRLDPAAGTLINLADCEEHLGHLATAWEAWQEAVTLLPLDDNRRPGAKRRAAQIEQKVPHLTIKLAADAPPDTRVLRDALELGAASLGIALPVDPGPHAVRATAAGHEESTTKVTLGEGESRVIEVAPGAAVAPAASSGVTPPASAPTLPPASASSPAPVPTPVAPAHAPVDHRGLRIAGWVSGGVGLAGIALGATTGVLAIGKKSTVEAECDPTRGGCSQAGFDASRSGHTLALVSDVGFIAGAALTAVGVWLVITYRPSAGEPPPIVVAPTPSGASISWRGSF